MIIDLKYVHIYIKDGYGPSLGPGLVNNVSGYPIGSTTMVVDGFTGVVQTGDQFAVAGGTDIYTVTSHIETAGATTSLTFTPALVVAAVDDDTIDIQTHQLNIKIGEGTLTYDEKRKMQYMLDRGLLDDVREADQEPIDVRLDFLWEHLTAASTDTIPTIEDAFKQRGKASNWVTSDPDTCRPYCVDLILDFQPPCPGENRELIVLPQFRWESFNHESKQGIVAVTGKCNVREAVITRG